MADLSSASTEALLGAVKPKTASPEAFAAQYGGVAEAAGKQLNVDPKLLLAQWGLETGWGKSVVPGTFNLGNIKDFSGGGVAATDNMTGSRDNYRAYASPEEFASDFAGLIGRKYKGAAGAGSDAAKYTAGLAGYAEDPQYATKLQAAYKRLNPGPLAAAADKVLSAVSGSAQAATPQDLSGISTDDLLAALGERAQAPTPRPSGASKLKGSAAGGVAMGLRDAVDAGAQLLVRALPDSVVRAGNSLNNALSENPAVGAAGGALGGAAAGALAGSVIPVVGTGVGALVGGAVGALGGGNLAKLSSAANGDTPSGLVAGARADAATPLDAMVKNANAEYDASRKLAGRDGLDLARIGGNILNPVNRLIPVSGAAGTSAVALRTAAQGALSGAATPVLDTDNFAGNKAVQIGMGGALGAAGGVAADKLVKGAGALVSRVRAAVQSGERIAMNADQLLQQAAVEQGVDLSAIPQPVLQSARDQVSQALRRNQELDARALLRAAEGRTVLGEDAGLTLGQATRDPQQFTREKNLRGIEGAGNALAERFALQNNRLIEALNARGAAAAPGEMQTANRLLESLRAYDAGRQQNVAGLYGEARSLNGAEIPLDAPFFVTAARDNLRAQMRDLHLPTAVSRRLERFESGETPLNISSSEQFKSILADEIAEAQARGKSNVVNALWTVRNALDNARPLMAEETSQGGAAIAAFNRARGAAASRFEELRDNPALRAAVDGAEPDRFFQTTVLNAPVREVRALLETVPDQAATVRQQVVDYLKQQALNGASDEVGVFSQSKYNRALSNLGNAKLAVIFSPDEVAQLRSIGKVASYIQSQPAGAAVNNSNTAAAVMNLLSKIGGAVGRFPFVNVARNSIDQFRNENAVANALSGQIPRESVEAPVNALRALLPPVAGGFGSLGAESGR